MRNFVSSVLLLLMGCSYTALPAMAATQDVPLKDLPANIDMEEVIFLPTIRSQREVTFTKPKTWTMQPGTSVMVEFQHSKELLPNRSWFQVILNDNVLTHVPMTAANAEATRLNVALPPHLIKDFNSLIFRVEQHYADICEDPLASSLWTQVLPATTLHFNYAETLPKVDLAQYPYPMVDSLGYNAVRVRYVLPKQPDQNALQAMAFVNTHLGQMSRGHELETHLSWSKESISGHEHLVYIGTPDVLPELAEFAGAGGAYKLSGGQWMGSTGQPLDKKSGLILFVPHPKFPGKAALVVTGNDSEGVLNAARFLVAPDKPETFGGFAYDVDARTAQARNGQSRKNKRFLETESRLFSEMELPTQTVEKINAPPITYKVPVVSDLKNSGANVNLSLSYSYSPKLNPEFSSLELRLNDRSIGSIPLTDVNGREKQTATIPIPRELLNFQNRLVAQFHLLPEKYGRCVDFYEDDTWGKIHDDSKIEINGGAAGVLPNIGLFNPTGFPYTRFEGLKEVQLVLAENYTPDDLRTLLALTGRLGRQTRPVDPIEIEISRGANQASGSKNVILIGTGALAERLVPAFSLKPGIINIFRLADGNTVKIASPDGASTMEEGGSGPVVALLDSPNAAAAKALQEFFETDKYFEKLESGQLKQLVSRDLAVKTADSMRYEPEGPWYTKIQWSLIGAVVLVILALFLVFAFIASFVRQVGQRNQKFK